MLVTRLVASPHQAHVTFWDDHLSVGLQRSRTVYLSPLLNPKTLLRDLAVLSFFGWSKLSRTMVYTWRMCLYCDNESAIKIANNPVQHSKTKHIENLSSLSQRSCYEGSYWYHSREHWRGIGRYLHKALAWEKVLQDAVWAKYLKILECSVTHTITLMHIDDLGAQHTK